MKFKKGKVLRKKSGIYGKTFTGRGKRNGSRKIFYGMKNKGAPIEIGREDTHCKCQSSFLQVTHSQHELMLELMKVLKK